MNEPLLSRRDAVLKTVAGIGVATVLVRSVAAQAQSADDQTILKALIRAERNAIETYKAGAGVISAATVADPLFHYQGVVLAIAKHFLAQHTDHEAKLVKYLTAQGGTDDVGAGSAQIPTGFVASIKNVVDLATNAEKAASIISPVSSSGSGSLPEDIPSNTQNCVFIAASAIDCKYSITRQLAFSMAATQRSISSMSPRFRASRARRPI